MAKTEKDSFEHSIKNHAKFINNGVISKTGIIITGKKKRELVKTTLDLMFGINQKKDNIHKTKQLLLF